MVYNLSADPSRLRKCCKSGTSHLAFSDSSSGATPILHSCLVGSVKEKVPDDCCSGSGAENVAARHF